jgi:hypothetical protein
MPKTKAPKQQIEVRKVETKKVAPKPNKEKKVINRENKPEFVQIVVRAVIPTQQYGNIQPEVTVKGGTFEQARDFAMPMIEQLYQHYAEIPVNGVVPKFFNKASVTAVEKKVDVPATVAPAVSTPASSLPGYNPDKLGFDKKEEPKIVKNEAYLKAENAIGSAHSSEALDLIEEQIQKSVKISPDDKPLLLTILLKKKKDLK